MTSDQYLAMVEVQLQEAKENMEAAEKKFREEKAKYDSVLSLKTNYLKWIGEK